MRTRVETVLASPQYVRLAFERMQEDGDDRLYPGKLSIPAAPLSGREAMLEML